jgi:hypothetical protein
MNAVNAEPKIVVRRMAPTDWLAVRAIYAAGIATFETSRPIGKRGIRVTYPTFDSWQ